MKGKEIAQLYVGLELSLTIRPKKELKGFAKIELEPGESKQVHIAFDDKTFRYFDIGTNKWEIEKGLYSIMIGTSVEDIVLQDKLEVEGTISAPTCDKTLLPNYAVGNLRNIPDEEFAALLGHPIPDGKLPFYKKNRMVIDYNTTFQELRYSKRWIGRLVGKAIPWFVRVLRKFGNRVLANTLVMGVVHQPMRGMSRFSQGGLRMSQLDGLIMIFNGHFFKGLHHFFKEGRKYKRLAKEEKKAEEAKKKELEAAPKAEEPAKEAELAVEQPKVEEVVVNEENVALEVEQPLEETEVIEEVPAEELATEESHVEEAFIEEEAPVEETPAEEVKENE